MSETICLDFDGVLHSYTSKWSGPAVIPDPPTPGAQLFCAALIHRGFNVVVMSTRANCAEGADAMRRWLSENAFPDQVKIALGDKPPAMVYVDDRGCRFEGNFEHTLAYIGRPGETPRPWNKPK